MRMLTYEEQAAVKNGDGESMALVPMQDYEGGYAYPYEDGMGDEYGDGAADELAPKKKRAKLRQEEEDNEELSIAE